MRGFIIRPQQILRFVLFSGEAWIPYLLFGISIRTGSYHFLFCFNHRSPASTVSNLCPFLSAIMKLRIPMSFFEKSEAQFWFPIILFHPLKRPLVHLQNRKIPITYQLMEISPLYSQAPQDGSPPDRAWDVSVDSPYPSPTLFNMNKTLLHLL